MRFVKHFFALCAVLSCSSLVLGQGFPVNGPYNPGQVYTVVIGAISTELEVPTAGTPPYWLSLSTLGRPVETSDKLGINNLANFMPPASAELLGGKAGSYLEDQSRRLDQLYEFVLDNLAFPVRTHTPEYKSAVSRIFEVDNDGNPKVDANGETIMKPKYKAYLAKLTALKLAEYATRDETLNFTAKENAQAKYDSAFTDFRKAGIGVEEALEIIDQEEAKFGFRENQLRRRNLREFRTRNTLIPGENKPPLSYFSPPLETWDKSSGWKTVKFSNDNSSSYYERHESQIHASGGLNLGLFRIGGNAGRKVIEELRGNVVQKFSFSFSLKRVAIFRPWFDDRIFDNPEGWTWKRKTTKDGSFPYVAVPRSKEGAPKSSNGKYENKEVGLALVPVQLVLAKDVTISATVSKADWKRIDQAHQAGASASLLGIIKIGDAGANFSDVHEVNNGKDVSFTATAPAIAIIGTISRILPPCPNPNPTEHWPDGAWLP